ncbi:response regulator transcription factor [Nitrospira sp. Nam74]
MPLHVLIVEDDDMFRTTLTLVLQAEGFSVRVGTSADEAIRLVSQSVPDIILSDVDLVGINGVMLCRHFKQDSRTRHIPLIMMSGRRLGERDQLDGLTEGADDYLLKPFSNKILVQKIRNLLVRSREQPTDADDTVCIGPIIIDAAGRRVTIEGKEVRLTKKEFDLLEILVRKRGRTLTPAILLAEVWGYALDRYDDPRTVKVHISSLRTKLGTFGEHIVNVPGVGYRFDPQI